jgi:hypothetical protein
MLIKVAQYKIPIDKETVKASKKKSQDINKISDSTQLPKLIATVLPHKPIS